MSKDTRNVPALRFKGFSDAWEKRKLIYFLNVSDQKNSKGTFSKKDVLSVSGEFGIVNQIQFQGRSFAGVSVKKYGIVEKGDIVYTKSPLKRNPFGIIKVNRGQAGIVSTLYAIYKPRKTVCPSIIDYYFQSDTKLNNYLRPLVNKGAKNDMKVKNIDVLKGLVILPLNLDEQKKDIFFLDNITNLIAATQDKLDHFEEIKKALLKHLFDQSMRFKGYSDPWEKRKLGELSNIRRGASPRPISSKKWFSETSSIGWLRISDVTEQNGRIYHVAQHLSKEGQEKTLVLTTKHLILSIAATVGKPVQNYIALGIHDGFIVFLNPKFDLDFMFYFLEDYQPKWSRFGQPGSQVNINSELVRELEINVPREDEQKKISHVLLNVDNLIAATQSKLSSLESLKKALLQGLFI